jgi:hypothetical protein
VFNTKGQFLRRLVSQGRLNAPWGLEIVNGALWVGNFGDGRINAYNPSAGSFVGTPRDVFGIPLEFDGLWDWSSRMAGCSSTLASPMKITACSA